MFYVLAMTELEIKRFFSFSTINHIVSPDDVSVVATPELDNLGHSQHLEIRPPNARAAMVLLPVKNVVGLLDAPVFVLYSWTDKQTRNNGAVPLFLKGDGEIDRYSYIARRIGEQIRNNNNPELFSRGEIVRYR